ncbi:hypothetical protein EV363DRAFT_1339072 [Boletus edulis]|nr:hypothetical protein EV363DRAFT_1339072 [Boletus edulis]
MRYSASVVLVPAYQESGIPTHPVGDPPALISTSLRKDHPSSSPHPSSTPSPEFSDEESPREPSNFSFHLYQDEEWTDEVEARMQNMIDQMLEDARRLLASPTINFSERFPDDFLEDSPNPRTSYGAEEEEGLGMDSRLGGFVVEEDAHSPPLSFKHAICFEERQWVAVRITTNSSAEPPIPPTPPDVYLRQRRRRWKPPDPYR